MTITIASAAAGINAAQQHLSKVAKESMTPEPKAEKQPNHIAKLKKRHAKVAAKLQKAVQPLNARLKPMNMLVWWDGEEYAINTQAADRSIGIDFRLGSLSLSLAQLMAMSDHKLETFLKGF